ncbi:MAG: hypothetical protein ACRYFW_17350 [Janthinobacterium lividum]
MILLPLLLAVAAQKSDRSTDRLPPANALPIEAPSAEQMALAPVLAIAAARNAADVLAQVRADGGVTLVTEATDGSATVRQLGWADYAARAGVRVQERLTDPAVDVDGATAMVWSPYTVTVDNRLDHCGVDHAALVREGGRWRVVTLTHSERTTGCGTR